MLNLFFYRNKNLLVFIGLMGVSLSLVTLNSVRVQRILYEGIQTVSWPLVWVLNELSRGARSFFRDTVYLEERLKEIEVLKEEVLRNRYLLLDKQMILEENLRLRKQLDYRSFVDRRISKSLSAEVIMRGDARNIWWSMIINKGRMDGVKEGMAVVGFQVVKKRDGRKSLERLVVGKVIQVSSLAAKVLPVTDRSFYIHGRIKGSDYSGFLEGLGKYGGDLLLRYVDKMAGFNVGAEVVTSGDGSFFPKGIKIGFIKGDRSEGRGGYMKVLVVEPYVDYDRLDQVLVILSGLSEELESLMMKGRH